MSPSLLKRRTAILLLLASGFMFLWTAVAHFFAKPISLIAVIYVLMTLFCIVAPAVLLKDVRHSEKLIRTAYGGIIGFLLFIKFPFVLWNATPFTVASEAVEILLWLFIVYTFSALVLDKRTGLAGNMCILLGSLALPLVVTRFERPTATNLIPWPHLYGFEVTATMVAFTMAYIREQHEQAARLAESMRTLAYTDYLTDLPNRRQLHLLLEQQVEEKSRYGGTFSVLMFDLDHFKRINDTFGHHHGDQVLVEISRVARAYLRKSDIIGRWGGEEFLIIAPNTNHSQAISLAERLRNAIADHFHPSNPVTASFGVATYQPGISPKQLIALADDALYRAKENGRIRVEAAG